MKRFFALVRPGATESSPTDVADNSEAPIQEKPLSMPDQTTPAPSNQEPLDAALENGWEVWAVNVVVLESNKVDLTMLSKTSKTRHGQKARVRLTWQMDVTSQSGRGQYFDAVEIAFKVSSPEGITSDGTLVSRGASLTEDFDVPPSAPAEAPVDKPTGPSDTGKSVETVAQPNPSPAEAPVEKPTDPSGDTSKPAETVAQPNPSTDVVQPKSSPCTILGDETGVTFKFDSKSGSTGVPLKAFLYTEIELSVECKLDCVVSVTLSYPGPVWFRRSAPGTKGNSKTILPPPPDKPVDSDVPNLRQG